MKRILTFAMLLFSLFYIFAESEEDKPVLAVMEIEDKTGQFQDSIAAATENLRNAMVSSNKFVVVTESRQRAKMNKLKEASYQGCYDEKCQIELGKELAADTILVTTINSLDNHYEIISTLIDLERGVNTKSALVTFEENEPLHSALKGISNQILDSKNSGDKVSKIDSEVKTVSSLLNSNFFGEYEMLNKDEKYWKETGAILLPVLGLFPTITGVLLLWLLEPTKGHIILDSVLLGVGSALIIKGCTDAVWDKYTKGERAAGFMIPFGVLAAAYGGIMMGVSDGNNAKWYGGITALAVGGGFLIGGITVAILDANARELETISNFL